MDKLTQEFINMIATHDNASINDKYHYRISFLTFNNKYDLSDGVKPCIVTYTVHIYQPCVKKHYDLTQIFLELEKKYTAYFTDTNTKLTKKINQGAVSTKTDDYALLYKVYKKIATTKGTNNDMFKKYETTDLCKHPDGFVLLY